MGTASKAQSQIFVPGCNPSLAILFCASQGKSLSLPLPQFPQLSNEYCIDFHKNNVGEEK